MSEIITRVRKLLALASSTDNEAEVELAFRNRGVMARQVIARLVAAGAVTWQQVEDAIHQLAGAVTWQQAEDAIHQLETEDDDNVEP